MKKHTILLLTTISINIFFFFSCKKSLDAINQQQVSAISNDNYKETSLPVQKRITHEINASVAGYLEALPASYSKQPDKKYPLLIFLHGRKGAGDGSFEELQRVEDISIPELIKDQKFPANFVVNDKTYQFIVISPQFKRGCWPLSWDVDDVVDFAIKKYRIDTDRIYLCGESMGGGGVWDYAIDYGKRLAAMVPIAGASWPTPEKGEKIAASNVCVWAFHNKNDVSVPSWYSINYVDYINDYDPLVPAKVTLLDGDKHNCWDVAIDPAYKEKGKNIYEWMLSYRNTN